MPAIFDINRCMLYICKAFTFFSFHIEVECLPYISYLCKDAPKIRHELPLDESLQASQSFITPDRIFPPTSVLNGTNSAVMYQQATQGSKFPANLWSIFLWCLDDLLLFSKTISDHLDALRLLFEFLKKFNFKHHAEKYILFAEILRWCDGLISSYSIRFGPRQTFVIRQIAFPKTGAHLQHSICSVQWMRNAITNFPWSFVVSKNFLKRSTAMRESRLYRRVRYRSF